jgi:hypothetical protein
MNLACTSLVQVDRSHLRRAWEAAERGFRGGKMFPTGVAVDSCCPLCGESVLSVSSAGLVLADDLHPIALYAKRGGGMQGYTLCDDCGVLADLPSELTLN